MVQEEQKRTENSTVQKRKSGNRPFAFLENRETHTTVSLEPFLPLYWSATWKITALSQSRD